MRRKPKDYRSKMAIYGDILTVIDENGGQASPTQILTGANLSHGRLVMHLEKLVATEVVKEEAYDDRRVYMMTEKGLELLQEMGKMRRFLDAFGLSI